MTTAAHYAHLHAHERLERHDPSPQHSPPQPHAAAASTTAATAFHPLQHHHHHTTTSNNTPDLLTNWSMPEGSQPHMPSYMHESVLLGPHHFASPYATSPYPSSSTDYQSHSEPTSRDPFETNGMPMTTAASYGHGGMISSVEATAMPMQWTNWQDFEAAMAFVGHDAWNDGGQRQHSRGSLSPTGTYLDVDSCSRSSSDAGWAMVEQQTHQMFDFPQPQAHQAAAGIFNPSQTLHLRSHSDSSHSEGGPLLDGTFEEMGFPPPPYSPFDPTSDQSARAHHHDAHRHCHHGEHHHQPRPVPPPPPTPIYKQEAVSPTMAFIIPIKIPTPLPPPIPVPALSSTSSSPPSSRRNSGPRKSPTTKVTKPVICRSSTAVKKDPSEKRVGRRRGPLLPEQRKQASEIRKLRACLRCKFLKKTCDKGDPCAGCQPSHARLWQVPCTRIDIKEIGYFLKDWRADYDRLHGRHVTVLNVKAFATREELIWVTHGYGFAMPVMARVVYVVDESCFAIGWTEASNHRRPLEFDTRTGRMSAGAGGISTDALSEYLDQHLDGPFEAFIDKYFEGTPFITEILKTAYRFNAKQKIPVIRKALKLVLAYNLTLHMTMVEQRSGSDASDNDSSDHVDSPLPLLEGLIHDPRSKFYGKTVAPTLINFQIKCALSDMWRELQREILTELSSLYSSVYSGDRLKNWPTIFMIASILLAVWEEMQFDCHYRTPDVGAVDKFCSDMETTPVGVIIGLFHAISQKLPAFTDWETRRHGQLLNNNAAVCDAMTEMREAVLKHEHYLKSRPEATFDAMNFDCLSNKFLAKLVIRAN